jgi:hypothetical protein
LDGDPEGLFVFLADAEENHLGILDLQTPQYLQTLEGFGYSVVKVSKDGSYTPAGGYRTRTESYTNL